MTYYLTMKEFKEWLEHFRNYDLIEPKIKVTRYKKGEIGRISLIRGGQTTAFFETKEYTIKAINKFIAENLKETKELPY